MSTMKEMLEQKRTRLADEYQSRLNWIRYAVSEEGEVESIAFEQNLQNQVFFMHEIKTAIREIDKQIEMLELLQS